MKNIFIVANWKSNKLKQDILDWFKNIAEQNRWATLEKKVIICPSFIHIPLVEDQIRQYNLPFYVGAQNISPFEEGKHTGEVNAKQAKEYADYVIIGHSERAAQFGETKQELEEKVAQAKIHNLIPIYCVDDDQQSVPSGVTVVTYEPPGSISPGPADTPQNAEEKAAVIQKKAPEAIILYGGNVTSKNVGSFTSMEHIKGVLVGRASLDPVEFAALISNA